MSSCKDLEKLVVLILDEMYVHEDLVFEKRTGKLVGFTSLGKYVFMPLTVILINLCLFRRCERPSCCI